MIYNFTVLKKALKIGTITIESAQYKKIVTFCDRIPDQVQLIVCSQQT